jgi:hypothetical protein
VPLVKVLAQLAPIGQEEMISFQEVVGDALIGSNKLAFGIHAEGHALILKNENTDYKRYRFKYII